jgi:hypothetical protein
MPGTLLECRASLCWLDSLDAMLDEAVSGSGQVMDFGWVRRRTGNDNSEMRHGWVLMGWVDILGMDHIARSVRCAIGVFGRSLVFVADLQNGL